MVYFLSPGVNDLTVRFREGGYFRETSAVFMLHHLLCYDDTETMCIII